jgi:hypothetical protein
VFDNAQVDELRLVRESFPSQAGKRWFGDARFRLLMRPCGMEAGRRYAEALTCRKLPLVVA